MRPCVDLVNTIQTTITTSLCASSSNLAGMLVKVTIDIYGNKLVKKIYTKSLCVSSLNLADMVSMVR